eukprot:3243121-Heterocapsa_arctica.AAC.1
MSIPRRLSSQKQEKYCKCFTCISGTNRQNGTGEPYTDKGASSQTNSGSGPEHGPKSISNARPNQTRAKLAQPATSKTVKPI